MQGQASSLQMTHFLMDIIVSRGIFLANSLKGAVNHCIRIVFPYRMLQKTWAIWWPELHNVAEVMTDNLQNVAGNLQTNIQGTVNSAYSLLRQKTLRV